MIPASVPSSAQATVVLVDRASSAAPTSCPAPPEGVLQIGQLADEHRQRQPARRAGCCASTPSRCSRARAPPAGSRPGRLPPGRAGRRLRQARSGVLPPAGPEGERASRYASSSSRVTSASSRSGCRPAKWASSASANVPWAAEALPARAPRPPPRRRDRAASCAGRRGGGLDRERARRGTGCPRRQGGTRSAIRFSQPRSSIRRASAAVGPAVPLGRCAIDTKCSRTATIARERPARGVAAGGSPRERPRRARPAPVPRARRRGAQRCAGARATAAGAAGTARPRGPSRPAAWGSRRPGGHHHGQHECQHPAA